MPIATNEVNGVRYRLPILASDRKNSYVLPAMRSTDNYFMEDSIRMRHSMCIFEGSIPVMGASQVSSPWTGVRFPCRSA